MATLRELLKLKGSTPGLYLSTSSSYSPNSIRIGFRPSTGGKGKRSSILDSKSFPNTPEGRSDAIKYYNKLKNKYKAEIAKYPTSKGFYMAQNRQAYTNLKKNFSDELIEEIDTLTKDPKYKTIKQVENQLFKKFNDPRYTVVTKGADPKNAFFHPDRKFFSIPREYELYGAPYGKKKIKENQVALRQIIGTKFFANSPNYEKVKELLTAFYTDPKSKFTKKETDTMRKFVKDFSITRSLKTGDKSIPARFFKELNFDFGRKLKEFGKIFNLTEYLKEQVNNPRISGADKFFYQKELNSLLNNRRDVLLPLSKKYPSLFKFKVSPAGNLQFEHRVARSLGETGDVKLPKDYIARGSYVPGRFNQAKYFLYDKPLMDLVSEYNLATRSEKPNVRLKIENLTKDFNTRSGGFLEPLKFDFKDKIKITDKSRLASEAQGADVLFDIDKSLEQSNKFFRSLGRETVKGLPKGSIASDFVLKGKEYKSFKKLVDTVKASPESCRQILDMQTGGISKTCAAALEKDPVGSAQKLSQLDSTGPLAKVKNAALGFLKSPGFKTFSVAGLAGTVGSAIVKEFRNDDPTTYLSSESQQKNMLVAMATDPVTTELPRPDILDFQLPLAGALAAGSIAATAPKTIEASRTNLKFASRAPGVEKKKPGIIKTGFRTLGRGLGAAASPGILAPLAAMDITRQVSEGDSPVDIATDPLNYLYPAFAEQTPKLTKGLPAAARKIASLGLGRLGLTVLSRAGLAGLGLSLGIQGYKALTDD